MGVGAALAMGLLQGFSKNMDEEKARRQAMRRSFRWLRDNGC